MIQNALLLGAAIPSTLLTELRGYWKLDGNGNDELGVSNGTVQGTGSSWNTGKLGQAFYAGGSARVNVGSNAQLKPTTAITLAGWFWFNGVQTANLRAVSDWHQNGALDRWLLGYSPDGTSLIGHMFGANRVLGSIGSTVAANTWVHLALTWQQAGGGPMVAYRNGAAVDSFSGYIGTLNAGSGANVCLGLQEEAGAGLNGRLDEFGLWGRALLASEVADLYNSGTGKSHPF